MILKDGTVTTIMSVDMTKELNRHLKKKIKKPNYKSTDALAEGMMMDTGSEKIWVCLLGIFNLRDSSIKLLNCFG